MGITLDTLKALDADKSYYLANSTGQIKEAGPWQRFKCWLGIGDGRSKVAALAEAVKTALLESAHEKRNADLDAVTGALDLEKSLSGESIKDVMRKFTAANTREIAQTTAGKMADTAIADGIAALKAEGLIDDLHAPFVARVLMHATKHAVANPPCLSSGELNVEAMKKQLDEDLASAKYLIRTCGNKKFDAFYADHFIKTLFNEDGTRNLATVDNLKDPRELLMEVGRENGEHAFTRKNVTTEEVAEALNLAIDECGDDPEALEVVMTDVTPNIMRGDDKLRPAESIKKRVAGLKANFDELRELAKDDPGLFPVAKRFMILLKGKSFPQGALTKVITTIKNAPAPKLADISLRTSAYGIHNALEDYRRICDQAVLESGMGDYLEGGDENTPFRDFVSRLVLAKFSRPQLRNAQLALEGPETGVVVSIYNRIGTKFPAPKMHNDEKNSVMMEALGRVLTMTEMKAVIDGLLGDEYEDICRKRPKGEAVEDGLPFALFDDLCEYCKVPKEHRPE